jgi:osmotically-inducible protein OsmY
MEFAGLGRRRRRGANGAGRLLGGMGGLAAGAGLMYFLDPRRGTARRADVKQRAASMARSAGQFVEAGARDLEHRARGLVHEAKARVRPDRPDEEILAERVRARLGRLCSHPRAIQVSVREGGFVELKGPVLEAEAERVVQGIRHVRGVREVDDDLRRSATAALQGGSARPPGPKPELLHETWAPGTRLAAGAAGLFLVGKALLGEGILRPAWGLAGAALLARAGANAPVRRVVAEGREKARGAAAEVKESPAERQEAKRAARRARRHGEGAAIRRDPSDEGT